MLLHVFIRVIVWFSIRHKLHWVAIYFLKKAKQSCQKESPTNLRTFYKAVRRPLIEVIRACVHHFNELRITRLSLVIRNLWSSIFARHQVTDYLFCESKVTCLTPVNIRTDLKFLL